MHEFVLYVSFVISACVLSVCISVTGSGAEVGLWSSGIFVGAAVSSVICGDVVTFVTGEAVGNSVSIGMLFSKLHPVSMQITNINIKMLLLILFIL